MRGHARTDGIVSVSRSDTTACKETGWGKGSATGDAPMTERGIIHFLLLLGSSSPLPADWVCAGAAVVVTMTVDTASVADEAPDADDAGADVPRLVAAPVEAAADESAVERDVPELGAVPELDAVGVVAV